MSKVVSIQTDIFAKKFREIVIRVIKNEINPPINGAKNINITTKIISLEAITPNPAVYMIRKNPGMFGR